jgi:hypothetical protein
MPTLSHACVMKQNRTHTHHACMQGHTHRHTPETALSMLRLLSSLNFSASSTAEWCSCACVCSSLSGGDMPRAASCSMGQQREVHQSTL